MLAAALTITLDLVVLTILTAYAVKISRSEQKPGSITTGTLYVSILAWAAFFFVDFLAIYKAPA
ncbi:hypothetical protein HOU02_gp195 [Caulobacter phage CcrBL9]|uniref:Uncharacterized protein n=1 Tax=Caulobacter phage CcrBL9 TaxID=2283270 RepID=A0A385ECZ8_9CAUD|nr:hypothetical protein HOU02_gp195 [Caulobacter phage CcrBL9]AXQ69530.1 hypothetical protein CcrBL9_gp506 [Caulobacter phage CcrBL9]